MSTIYFLKFFFKLAWVLEINESFFTTSMNLLIGSSPILFNTSLSILTSCVWRSRSSGGGVGFICLLLALIGWMLWELYKLFPNILVWVVFNPPALIFLLSCKISSERADYFSFNSSEYIIIRSTTSLSNCWTLGLCFSSGMRHFPTNYLN